MSYSNFSYRLYNYNFGHDFTNIILLKITNKLVNDEYFKLSSSCAMLGGVGSHSPP